MTMDKALLLQKAPLAAAVALTVGMLASFGIQAYKTWQLSQERAAEVQNVAVAPKRTANAPEAKDLVRAHLFGQPVVAPQPQAVQTENLPTTNLKLTLRGVSASPVEERASALVEGPDQQTQVYLIGDRLPGNAVLRAVYPNRIVIERSGRLENLNFPETSDNSSASISSYSDSGNGFAQDSDDSIYSQESDPGEQSIEQTFQETTPEQEPAEVYEPPAVAEPAPEQASPTNTEPTYVLDALSEERKQEIRERLQRLREQIINQ